MSYDAAALAAVLERFPLPRRYLVAFSGGVDSTVLLHALCSLREQGAVAALRAAHVHHGLQADADRWCVHCAEVCRQWGVELVERRISVDPAGEGLEAAARRERYRALAQAMQEGEILLTAQHRDDQAETVLLQLLRGAGPAGLAGMPVLKPFTPGWHLRPLLEFSRAQLEAYAREQALAWVEDPSNRVLDQDRNYLRHEIMPRLQRRWPGAAASLARSAAQCAEADDLLYRQGLELLQQAAGEAPSSLSVTSLRRLQAARQRLLLRTWLREKGVPLPSRRRLDALLRTVTTLRADAEPVVPWAGRQVRRYRDALFLLPDLPPPDPGFEQAWDGAADIHLPRWGIHYQCVNTVGGGMARRWLESDVVIRFRRGGERCRLPGRAHGSELKKLWQAAGVPPWERERTPLIFVNGQLAMVGDRWVCEPFQAAPGEAGIGLRSIPHHGEEEGG